MSLRSPIPGSRASSNAAGRFDRIFALTGLGVAVVTVGVGLVAQVVAYENFGGSVVEATGYEWVAWVAAGLVAVAVVGVVRNSIRYSIAYERPRGFGWIVSSWLVVLMGSFLARLGFMPDIMYPVESLRWLFTVEIAVPSAIMGIALGLASVGLLRGSLRPGYQWSHRIRVTRIALVSVAVVAAGWGLFAWFSQPSVGDLRAQSGMDVRQFQDGTTIVWDSPGQFLVEPQGYEGREPPEDDWDQWIVHPDDSMNPVFGPAPLSEAVQYVADNDAQVLFAGTADEFSAWLEGDASIYKSYFIPGLLITIGAILALSALTLGPVERQARTMPTDERGVTSSV